MHCSQCGHPIKSATASFCAYCGTKLEVPSDELDKTVSASTARRRNKEADKPPMIFDPVSPEQADIRTVGTPGTREKETAMPVSQQTAENKKNTEPVGSFASDDFFDPDATVRVFDEPVKKYNFNNDRFDLPEPEEEDVFETTAEDIMADPIVKASFTKAQTYDPFNDSALDSRRPEVQSQGYNQRGGYNGNAQQTVSREPNSKVVIQRPERVYPYSENAANANNMNGQYGWAQPESREGFTQAGTGADNFFVQQAPVYNQQESKKMKPGMLVLIIVLIVVLFAVAVAGGIFVASAILNNAVIDNVNGIVFAFLNT